MLPNHMKACKDLDIFKASVRNWNEPMCKCRMCAMFDLIVVNACTLYVTVYPSHGHSA